MTLRGLTYALILICLLLGIGHIALTPLLYRGWTIDSLWFVGTGLAMMTGAAANILGLGSAGRLDRFVIVSVDVGLTLFFLSAWWVLPEPQVIVGGVLFASLAILQGRSARERLV